MRIYLDTCSLQRPLDERSQTRVHLEAEAILSVLDLIGIHELALLSYDVLIYEIERNPHRSRRDFALETLTVREHIGLSPSIVERAEKLNLAAIKALDRLHLASAEAGGADFLCTCDDHFLKKAKRHMRGNTKIVSPIELVEEIRKWQSQRDQ